MLVAVSVERNRREGVPASDSADLRLLFTVARIRFAAGGCEPGGLAGARL